MVYENICTGPPRPMVGSGAFSHKIEWLTSFRRCLDGHQNCITWLKVTAILLNGWIFPIGQSQGIPRLIFTE